MHQTKCFYKMPVVGNVHKLLTDTTYTCTALLYWASRKLINVNTGLCMFTCPGEIIVVPGRSDRMWMASPVAGHEARGLGGGRVRDGFSSGHLAALSYRNLRKFRC